MDASQPSIYKGLQGVMTQTSKGGDSILTTADIGDLLVKGRWLMW